MDRPNCKCHGEPMVRNRGRRGRVQWDCATRRREYNKRRYRESGLRETMRAKYQDRKEREVCVRCEGPLTSEALCWDCLNEMEDRRAVCI